MTSNGHDRSLVVIQLSGGNDYLNTLVPYNEGLYYDYRPAVKIEPEQVLKLDDQYGFRPGMEPVKRLWDEGKVAIVNGIGYPNPNRSHFRSMDIWHLRGADILRTALEKYSSTVEYAANPIARNMKSIAQVMLADLGTRIYYTQHGSFDTHAGELADHSKLWDEVSGAVGDFMDDLKEHGSEDDAVVLIYSEFGRRIKDNGSGTDHGAAGVAFVIGGAVDGGLYGEFPSLEEKDRLDGDQRPNNDFRSTYATILERWLGLESAPIVNGNFEQLDFVGKS